MICKLCGQFKTIRHICSNKTQKVKIGQRFNIQIESGARARGHKIDITPEEAWQLFLDQNRKCALSGMKLMFKSRWDANDGTASLDRMDSNGDYTIDNVQWIHKDINLIKTQSVKGSQSRVQINSKKKFQL